MRKFALLLLSILMVTCLAFAAACSPGNTPPTNSLSLNRTNLTVVESFSEEIQAIYSGKETIEWISGDESIATVDDGVVSGVSAGSTVVTARAEGQSVQCNVTVTAFDNQELRLVPDDANLSLVLDEVATLNCKLYYGNVELSASEITYTLPESQVVELSGSAVTANSIGSVSVVASTQFKGFTVNAVINVSVTNSITVSINEAGASVYAIESFDGENYETTKQLTVTAKQNGVNADNAQISWSSADEKICTVANGLVKGVAVGRTTVTATYIVDDEEVSDSIYVDVIPVEIDATLKNSEIDMSEAFALDTADFFKGESLTVTSVKVSNGSFDKTIRYENGSLYFDDVVFVGENSINLLTDKVNFTFEVYLWNEFIDEGNFDCLLDATYGHYKLTEDIDLSESEWVNADNNVFTGLLDGNGHSVTNFTVKENGIFAKLGEGAVIKNVTFKNAVINSDTKGVGVLGNAVVTLANVTVDNVSAELINKGVESGGLFGVVEADSKLYLNNVNVFAYSDGTDGTRGAIAGASSGKVENATNVNVYSSMDACSTETAVANTTYEAFNVAVSTVKPTVYQQDNDVINCYETDGYSFEFNVDNVISATVYSNTKKTINSSTITLATEDYEYIFDGGVEVLFKLSDNSYKHYVLGVYSELHINQDNIELLKTIRKGTIYLDEDITIGKWQATDGRLESGKQVITEYYNFDGVFDGQGYTINGLDFSFAGTGLFYKLTGHVKNISVIGVKLNQGNVATFAAVQGNGDLTFENVYVSVDQVLSGGYQGALVERNNTGYTTIAKDVYVELPTTAKQADRYAGFVSGFRNNKLEMENCVFVGGTGYVTSSLAIGKGEGYTYFADVSALNNAITADEFEFNTEYIKSQYNKYNGVLVITKSNIDVLKDETLMASTKNIVLGEDIDMSVEGARTVWTTTAKFNGTFDGNGHYISGLEMKTSSGLFHTFTGTVKNLALLNIRLNGGNTAGIAYISNADTVVENVLVQISDMSAGEAWRGGLFERGAGSKIITDTVVVFEVETNPVHCGYLAGHNGGYMALDNVYMVGSGERQYKPTNTSSNPGGSLSKTSVYWQMTKADFLAGISAETPTVTGLSEQMMTWIATYVK